ncbi:hypothetical protein JMJ35_009565 [Cladonia borealis]|uniref:Uncharacterized protein n=1 Tax=Cladonia borealis TaxID=184061 RepID=A0AA39QSJ7_9LECA|nr:hypothetical protein JMJ35_009565 [Cladonia borealis]
MKRTNADLDSLPSSPSPKRLKNATRHTSTLAVQDPSSQSSTGSSPSTLVASLAAPSLTTSSLEDSEQASGSSTSSQSDSGSSNTFSSESELFQRPVGRDPNDSQESHYNSDIDSSDSELNSSDSEFSERPGSWKAPPDNESWKAHFVLSAFGNRPINWDTDSTSTRANYDPEYGPRSSKSASISDDVSQASSSVSQASSSSSGSSFSSEPAAASENSNLSSSSASLSTSPSPTTAPHAQLSTTNLAQLQSRLQTLLPKLESANQELEIEKAEGRLGERDIEKVEEEGERYIEMELGLGVLEEKGDGEGEERGEGEEKEGEGEGDVLGKLMGKKEKRKGRGKRKIRIEEVGG